MAIACGHFDRNECRSCVLLPQAYAEQQASKLALCHGLLDALGDWHWLPSVPSPLGGFRNKAKMAVSGTSKAPILGIIAADGSGTDLSDCALYPPAMQACFAPLAHFIGVANIAPYDIATRHGELKYLLLSMAASGEWMLRFVLRSREALGRIRKHLPSLREALPQLRVVSVNLLPEHKAVLEGDQEILLSAESDLAMPLNDVPLYLRPRGFFQTNSVVAAALYAQVRDWCAAIAPPSVLDLFCGVGGFALHCADGVREVTGIETSADAIACAQRSAREMGLAHTTFHSTDALAFASKQPLDAALVIVNPPRRGLGAALCNDLQRSNARWLIYSSCNAQTLVHDLQRLSEFIPREVRLFDMFPHTRHFEVATLLERRGHG
ncbi:MAG: 23S rRNA (uracil(747)-C(5))-methyltransferase RlmC [Xanthomonadales bacterium]|nr:23S rRNA (uracil(747)-C(5))-methyltransferase RlmC [Xanthomonadales bacterium]